MNRAGPERDQAEPRKCKKLGIYIRLWMTNHFSVAVGPAGVGEATVPTVNPDQKLVIIPDIRLYYTVP